MPLQCFKANTALKCLKYEKSEQISIPSSGCLLKKIFILLAENMFLSMILMFFEKFQKQGDNLPFASLCRNND
jgi:hypothetical protein